MTSKEIERRVEGILKSVGVENELSYNVTKEDDGTFKKEIVGSVPRFDHAKGELLALIQQARVEELGNLLEKGSKPPYVTYDIITDRIAELKGKKQ